MTREEIISGLQMTMDLVQFDPSTGNVRPVYTLNDLDKTTYLACKKAIEALKAQTPCEDAVSRQTLQKELALYLIDDITCDDEAGYNRAINDVQKMVLHLPSAQPVLDRTKISDLLEKIYSIQSVHLSVEGVLARKYYCKQLWIELFGSEDVPKWID